MRDERASILDVQAPGLEELPGGPRVEEFLRRRVVHFRRLGNRDAEEAGRVTLGAGRRRQKRGEQNAERRVQSAEWEVDRASPDSAHLRAQ